LIALISLSFSAGVGSGGCFFRPAGGMPDPLSVAFKIIFPFSFIDPICKISMERHNVQFVY
jgi:hypothetical protein